MQNFVKNLFRNIEKGEVRNCFIFIASRKLDFLAEKDTFLKNMFQLLHIFFIDLKISTTLSK